MMNRLAEVIYVVPEEREAFLDAALHRSKYVEDFMYAHGVRNQYYFKFGEYIIMTFSYVGKNFGKDMAALGKDPEVSSRFVQRRKRDVPEQDLEKVNWWAPLLKYGAILTVDTLDDFSYRIENRKPSSYDEDVYRYYNNSEEQL